MARPGRGALGLGVYLVLAVVLFTVHQLLLAGIATGLALSAVVDMIMLARRRT